MPETTPKLPEFPTRPPPAERVMVLLSADFTGEPVSLDEVRAKLEASPDDPSLLEWYAHSLYSCQQFDEAIRVYNRLLEAEPSNVLWLLYRSNSLFLFGQREQARDGWSEILEYSADSRVGRRALGLLRGEEVKEEVRIQPPLPLPRPVVPRTAEGPVRKAIAFDAGGSRRRPPAFWAGLVAATAGILLLVLPGQQTPAPPSAPPTPAVVAVAQPEPDELGPAVGSAARARRRRARAARATPPPPPDPAKVQQASDIRRTSALVLIMFSAGILVLMWGSSPPRR